MREAKDLAERIGDSEQFREAGRADNGGGGRSRVDFYQKIVELRAGLRWVRSET